jgi:hypothetical protein
MMRGTFANIRIKNKWSPASRADHQLYPDRRVMPIYDAAMRYKAEGTPLVIIAGKEYGTGSSRDWAAKGTNLLGVRAVIAETFERIHRSNLVGMGVIPLQFVDAARIRRHRDLHHPRRRRSRARARRSRSRSPRRTARVELRRRVRIDTANELEYFRAGGILHYAAAARAERGLCAPSLAPRRAGRRSCRPAGAGSGRGGRSVAAILDAMRRRSSGRLALPTNSSFNGSGVRGRSWALDIASIPRSGAGRRGGNRRGGAIFGGGDFENMERGSPSTPCCASRAGAGGWSIMRSATRPTVWYCDLGAGRAALAPRRADPRSKSLAGPAPSSSSGACARNDRAG